MPSVLLNLPLLPPPPHAVCERSGGTAREGSPASRPPSRSFENLDGRDRSESFPTFSPVRAVDSSAPCAPPPPRYLLCFDGAAKHNPTGPAAGGYVLYSPRNAAGLRQVVVEGAVYHPAASNNYAEYSGLIAGLQAALTNAVTHLDTYGDSTLVVEQVTGNWNVKVRPRSRSSALLQPAAAPLQLAADDITEAKQLVSQFISCTLRFTPRANNGVADALANEGIQLQSRFERQGNGLWLSPPVDLIAVSAPAVSHSSPSSEPPLILRCPVAACPKHFKVYAHASGLNAHIQKDHLFNPRCLLDADFRAYLTQSGQWVCLTCLHLRRRPPSSAPKQGRPSRCICGHIFDASDPNHIHSIVTPALQKELKLRSMVQTLNPVPLRPKWGA